MTLSNSKWPFVIMTPMVVAFICMIVALLPGKLARTKAAEQYCEARGFKSFTTSPQATTTLCYDPKTRIVYYPEVSK